MTDGLFPPGPGLPTAMQAAWLAYRPYCFLDFCRDRFGEAFTIATPVGRVPIFGRPEHAERIFELDGTSLLGGQAQRPAVAFAGDQSLMKLDRDEHRNHRELIARSLRVADLPDGGNDLLERARRAVALWPVGRRFDLGAALEELAIDLSADLGIGGLPEEIVASSHRALRKLRRATTVAGLVLAAMSRRRQSPFIDFRQAMEGHLEELIGRGDSVSPCVFQRLARQSSSRGFRLSPRGLRDEMMTLYVAMVGGLSCSMKHSFYWALRTPGVGSKVYESTFRMLAANDAQAVAAEPFLDSVCKEVLRLCPDIPFAVRQTTTDIEIGGWRLPAGTTLGLGIYLIHRREASFPDAGRFIPDRFLTARPSRFEYLPFGGGRRGCVAASLFCFAQKLIIAAAFERHQLRLCDRRANPVTSLGIVSTRARSLWAVAEPLRTRRLVVHAASSTGPVSQGQRPRMPQSAGRCPIH